MIFVGEDGIDHGALRTEFLTLLLDDANDGTEKTHNLYNNAIQFEVNPTTEELSRENLSKRLFCFGLFCGIQLHHINKVKVDNILIKIRSCSSSITAVLSICSRIG